MSKVRSLTELCVLQVSVESYVVQKVGCNTSAASALDARSVTSDSRPGVLRVGAPTSPADPLSLNNSLSAAATWERTRLNTRLY